MSDTPKNQVAGASVVRALQSLCDYAYEQGFHEIGYDPVEEAAVSMVCKSCPLFDRYIDPINDSASIDHGLMQCSVWLCNDGTCPINDVTAYCRPTLSLGVIKR